MCGLEPPIPHGLARRYRRGRRFDQMSPEHDARFSVSRGEGPDLHTQFEALLHQVWEQEAAWREEDRIDMAARLYRET